jgi:hypothetical protein
MYALPLEIGPPATPAPIQNQTPVAPYYYQVPYMDHTQYQSPQQPHNRGGNHSVQHDPTESPKQTQVPASSSQLVNTTSLSEREQWEEEERRVDAEIAEIERLRQLRAEKAAIQAKLKSGKDG